MNILLSKNHDIGWNQTLEDLCPIIWKTLVTFGAFIESGILALLPGTHSQKRLKLFKLSRACSRP